MTGQDMSNLADELRFGRKVLGAVAIGIAPSTQSTASLVNAVHAACLAGYEGTLATARTVCQQLLTGGTKPVAAALRQAQAALSDVERLLRGQVDGERNDGARLAPRGA